MDYTQQIIAVIIMALALFNFALTVFKHVNSAETAFDLFKKSPTSFAILFAAFCYMVYVMAPVPE